MTKSEIVKDMKSYAGSAFINRTDFAKYMGVSMNYADRFLKSLDKIGRFYFIPDLAEVLMKERTAR